MRCPSFVGSTVVLRVAHLSESDAPIVYLLEMFEGGTVRLEKVGLRAYCTSIPSTEIEEIRSLLHSTTLDEIGWSEAIGLHREEVHIRAGEAEVRLVLEEAPAELLVLFRAVDQTFSDRFGSRYDMPLIR